MADFLSNVNTFAEKALANPNVSGPLTLFLVLYAGMAKPQLPDFIASLFDNAIFRLLVLALVVYTSTKNLRLSLIVAVAFSVTMSMLAEQKVAEGFIDSINENFNDVDDINSLRE
jgi:hypothetical protein